MGTVLICPSIPNLDGGMSFFPGRHANGQFLPHQSASVADPEGGQLVSLQEAIDGGATDVEVIGGFIHCEHGRRDWVARLHGAATSDSTGKDVSEKKKSWLFCRASWEPGSVFGRISSRP